MNVLITGVSKGLGLRVAELFLERDNRVFGISRSKTKELEILSEKYPTSFKWLSYDLSQKSINVQKDVFVNFIGKGTVINVFVNNAAIAYDDIVTNININRLEEMYWTNTLNPFLFVKYAIRNMILNGIRGSIIHISSISVHTGYNGLSMYASTKGALEAFSKNTAREWGKHGIRSNCIVAGFMDTNMSSSLDSSQRNRIYNRTALKVPTSIDSVAETILFIASDSASSITGQNIFVDSGTI